MMQDAVQRWAVGGADPQIDPLGCGDPGWATLSIRSKCQLLHFPLLLAQLLQLLHLQDATTFAFPSWTLSPLALSAQVQCCTDANLSCHCFLGFLLLGRSR